MNLANVVVSDTGTKCESMEQLVIQLRGGDAAAFSVLSAAFEPFLRRVARKYRGVSFEDALQEALLSLWNCVLEYDETLAIAFEAYAILKIRGDVRTAMRRLWRHNDRRYVASEKKIEESDGNLFDSLGFESPDGGNEYGYIEVLLSIESAGLSPRERLSVEALLKGRSNKELALECGVSHESVKTWRKRAVRKMRTALASECV